jgi:hypothetical protein
VIDVKGAFLKGQFFNGEDLYLQIPQGIKSLYGRDKILHLKWIPSLDWFFGFLG